MQTDIILHLPKDDIIILIFNNHDPFIITVSVKWCQKEYFS